LAILAAAMTTGCAEKKPPKKQGDWMDNLKVENPDAEPDLSGMEDEPDPEPKPDAEPPKPAPTVRPSSGRPLIQYGPKPKIESTFGATPGSKLTLSGGITLVIPEFALDGGYNIVWKTAGSSAPKKGPVVGGIAYLKISPGEKLEARKVKSKGDPFQVRLDTGGAETVNLAIGEVKTDKQGNEQGKPAWTVVAPKKVDKIETIGKGAGTKYTATFELPTIGPVLYLHATSADPG
jgi:hypothetical protein